MTCENARPIADPLDRAPGFPCSRQSGQLARAASRLGVDATTVSRRIRKLEARLATTLFEQARSGQVLTEAGVRLLALVEDMQRAAGQIEESPTIGIGVMGTIRLSVSEGFGTWFLAHALGQFHQRHPAAVIELAATSGFLSPSKRETDIAVMLARPRTGPVVSRKLSDYRLRFYAARSHAAGQGDVRTIADLPHQTLVGYIPDLLYAPELRYLDELHPGLEPVLRSSSINAQHRMIASGAGIGVLPCFMGDADQDLVPLLPDRQITRSFWVVTHRDTRQLQRVRAFHDWLSGMVADHQSVLLGED